jgi:peptide/nickel transport system ATP-binding protein
MVRELTTINDVAAVYISHDLAVVREIAQHLVVLYAGRMAETGSAQAVFEAPSHPYTEVLLRAIPDVELPKRLPIVTGHAPQPGERPPGCAFAPRCSMAVAACSVAPPPVDLGAGHLSFCHRTQDVVRRPDVALPARAASAKESVLQVQGLSVGYAGRDVVRAVDFELFKGECLALVGESGSGKTTLSKAIVGLLEPSEGTVRVMGEPVAPRARDRSQQMRRTLQYIFQSPYNSLNPRHTIGDILRRPLQLFFPVSKAEARERAVAALRRVALTPAVVDRYPNQLSGGERQRVAIARALVCDPSVLVCDEITSALDVSVQASIVDLLYRLREESGLSLLFVTHNLALVRSIADEVCVLKDGVVVETGEVADVLSAPEADYTRALLDDTPRLVGATMLEE